MPADAFELLNWIVDALAGWRYLISPSFRKRTHDRWRRDGWATALIEILFGSLALIFTAVLICLLILFLFGRTPG